LDEIDAPVFAEGEDIVVADAAGITI